MNLFFASSKRFEEKVSRQVAEACDQITSEMGAEIHDDLIQKLSIFRLYLDRLEQSARNPDETAKLLLSMRTDFENVIQSVRRISRQLMPVNTAYNTLSEGVKLLCQDMERPGSGNIHLSISGDEQSISAFSTTYLLRIIQELVHNSFKHSSAWHIWVRLEWDHRHLIIEVEDDGTGFNRISEFIDRLRAKNNTLRMRSQTLGASLTYHHGRNGLLARVQYRLLP